MAFPNIVSATNARCHLMIRMAANNPVIFHMISNVVALDVAFRERAYVDIQEVEMGFADHKAIFEAIKQRNPDLAEERMKNHVSRSAKRVLDKFKT
jgi:DNA-binding GntR family transcriptional regulator